MDEKEKKDLIKETTVETEKEVTEEFPLNEPTEVPEVEETTDKSDSEPKAGEEGEGSGEKAPDSSGTSEGGGEETPSTDSEEPTKLDTEEEKDLPEKSEEEVKEEVVEENKDIPPTEEEPTKTTEDLLAEIEDLKFQQETQQHIQNFTDVVKKQESEYEEFSKALEQKVLEEFTKYGIPLDCNINELKEVDPGKYQIMNHIIDNAKRVNEEISAQLRQPIIEASENIVFRVAGQEMKKYGLTEEEGKEAATTFIRMMNEVGIRDLGDDIKNKVELAVARAKMVLGHISEKNIKEVVQEVKEVAKDAKEAVKETVKEVKETGKKLEDFTKGVTTGTPQGGADVTADNVMDLYLSKKGNDRIAFFQKHQNLIMEQLKKGTQPYSDNRRYW